MSQTRLGDLAPMSAMNEITPASGALLVLFPAPEKLSLWVFLQVIPYHSLRLSQNVTEWESFLAPPAKLVLVVIFIFFPHCHF